MNIAIIPARGGSKRILRKNIKEFCGHPMISYAIKGAIKSGIFEHIIVSTEDKEIANIAIALGAKVPFMRPIELAGDYSTTAEVIAHAIKWCQDLGLNFNHACCIYPGVPFLQSEDLKGALNYLINSTEDYCFPVAKYHSSIQRSLKFENHYRLKPFYPEYELVRTQDLEPAYFDAGQFYWGRTHAWVTNNNIYRNSLGYEIPNWRVVDIDTHEDWKRAELLYRTMKDEVATNNEGFLK